MTSQGNKVFPGIFWIAKRKTQQRLGKGFIPRLALVNSADQFFIKGHRNFPRAFGF
jgi:hypothetical protein